MTSEGFTGKAGIPFPKVEEKDKNLKTTQYVFTLCMHTEKKRRQSLQRIDTAVAYCKKNNHKDTRMPQKNIFEIHWDRAEQGQAHLSRAFPGHHGGPGEMDFLAKTLSTSETVAPWNTTVSLCKRKSFTFMSSLI